MQHNFQSYVAEIEKTYSIIEPHIQNTPLLNSKELDTKLGMQVFCKAENLQITGSFKIRGALSAISRLTDEQLKKGVLAYSSGNHAQGVAKAAQCYSTKATIVMPKDAPSIKIAKTQSLNPKIIFYDRESEVREEIGAKIAEKNGLTIIKPYDAMETIYGQGTAAVEAIKQTSKVFDVALICAGGGGLTAGCSIIFKHHNPNIQIFTTEPHEWNDQEQSYASGSIQVAAANGSGLCDGLLTPKPGKIPFSINFALGIQGLSCEEQYIYEAMQLAKDAFAVELEPSGAIALANLIKHKDKFQKKNVFLTFSGGNVDPEVFNECVAEAKLGL